MSQLQDWYLSNMGVVKYTLRDTFPEDVADQEIPEETISSSRSKQTIRSRESDVIIGAIKANLPSSRPAEEPPEVKPEVIAEKIPVAETVVTFTIACWHPVDDLLIIDDLNDAAHASSDEQQLISNILFAIGRRPLNAAQLKPEILNWPGKSPDTSEAGARTMLSMFLASRIRSRGVCWVLLMGSAARLYLDEIGEQAEGNSVQLAGGATGLLLPSLSELLQTPALKRDVWSAIKHLAPKPQA